MMHAKILVVEDEPVIALDLEQRLLQLGYQVAGIADAAEVALKLVDQTYPNLVLADIRLQGQIDGIDLAAQIRDRYNLPVVFLTAHADAATLDRAITTRPFGYLVKPFQSHDLNTTIAVALSRHQAELAIQTALQQEQELNDLKSQFVSIVAHEFRNPLNVILFSIDLLTQYQEKLPEAKKQLYFTRARNAVVRMKELLEKVLVLGKAEAGKLECSPNCFDLLQFCRELVDEVQVGTAAASFVKFCPDLTTLSQPQICLDADLLRHILSNLLSNAIKYSPEGGKVWLKLVRKADTVVFQIRDQGIGIPVADQARLFTSFYRSKNTRGISGTGLGLSIVKQCVEAHNGAIQVQS
jgi:signal transduction histidine kinase